MTDIVIATEHGEVPQTAEEKAKQLPKPVGYKILVALPEVDDKYESGLVKAGTTVHYEEVLSTVFFVVALGPDCYTDKTRYPTGPWCKSCAMQHLQGRQDRSSRLYAAKPSPHPPRCRPSPRRR